jgi:predicted PurR-regulated permease PerM
MNKNRLDHYLKIIVMCVIVVVTIYYSSNIVMPILLSGVVSIILYPMVRKTRNWGVPKPLAVTLIVLLVSVCLTALLFAIGLQTQKIIAELPKGETKVEKVLDHPLKSVEQNTNVEVSDYAEILKNALNGVQTTLVGAIPSVVNRIKNTIVFFLTCPVYIFFMLLYSENIRDFYLQTVKNRSRGEAFIAALENTYKNYVKGMIVVMVIVASLTGLGLFLLGIKYAIFIGALTGVLTLLPYVGVILSASIPVLLALLTKDSLWFTFGVIAVYAVVQFLEGNFITPKIVGNQVNINPLIVIVGLVVFGAIGGIAGMIITIPVLAFVKTLANHNPSWQAVKTLIEVR